MNLLCDGYTSESPNFSISFIGGIFIRAVNIKFQFANPFPILWPYCVYPARLWGQSRPRQFCESAKANADVGNSPALLWISMIKVDTKMEKGEEE